MKITLHPAPGKGLFSIAGLSATAHAGMLRALVSAKPTHAPVELTGTTAAAAAAYVHPVSQSHQICMYTGVPVRRAGEGGLAAISFSGRTLDPALAGGVAWYANLAHRPRFTAVPVESCPHDAPADLSTYLLAAKSLHGVVEIGWDYNAVTDDPDDADLHVPCACGCGGGIIEFAPAGLAGAPA